MRMEREREKERVLNCVCLVSALPLMHLDSFAFSNCVPAVDMAEMGTYKKEKG
jgi:hypothetical protein